MYGNSILWNGWLLYLFVFAMFINILSSSCYMLQDKFFKWVVSKFHILIFLSLACLTTLPDFKQWGLVEYYRLFWSSFFWCVFMTASGDPLLTWRHRKLETRSRMMELRQQAGLVLLKSQDVGGKNTVSSPRPIPNQIQPSSVQSIGPRPKSRV